MGLVTRDRRRALATIAVFATMCSAASAHAHDDAIALAGRKLNVKQSGPESKRKLVITTAGAVVPPEHDPRRSDGAALLVRTIGTASRRTRLVPLDPSRWRARGPGAFLYQDPQAIHGVKKISVARDGITIIAKGPRVSPAIDGPIESLWVHLRVGDQWYCARFAGKMARNEPGRIIARASTAPEDCPAAVCGNGGIEPGEACDDGNLNDADGCTSACVRAACDGEAFASTWEALRTVVFERGGCTAAACHGAPPGEGGLVLAGAGAYASLIDAPATNASLDRVEPGDQDLSFLYLKLAAATRPETYPDVPGTPMPAGGLPPLSADVLDALRLWIRAGAPETGVVDGTDRRLHTCLPPPTPQKIRPLPAPALGVGAQFHAPPWSLPAESEDEVCYVTYYDLSQAPGAVPDWARAPCPPGYGGLTRECFRYHATTLSQDPQSHHSIIAVYRGASGPTDFAWGTWTCKGGAQDGSPCDPMRVGTAAPAGADCGGGAGCSGPVQSSVACIGFGPGDFALGGSLGLGFAGAQEPLSTNAYAPGVYDVLPMRGIVIWNSHAFNLTGQDSTMEQYLNIEFAPAADQRYPIQGVFDAREIFVQNVPPFERREYCSTFAFPPQARVFELSSHTHKRGVLFRIWAPPNAECTASGPAPCEPNREAPIYVSTDYSDPVKLRYDPPRALASGNAADRRYKYCAVYDNGAVDPTTVKRRSASNGCTYLDLLCLGGPRHGVACVGDDSRCDSSPGAGDGACDACPVVGGVTTEDEMLILLGGYYVAP